jgi:hypothetical protein
VCTCLHGFLYSRIDRSCAVCGGTYILGRPYTITYDPRQEEAIRNQTTEAPAESEPPTSDNNQGSNKSEFPLNFHIQIDGIDDQLRARYIIATHDEVSKMNDRTKDNKSPSTSKQGEYQSIKLGRCIAIIEAPVYFKRRQSPKTAQQNSQENIERSEDKPKEDGDTSSPIEDESDGLVDSAILVFPHSASDSQANLKHPAVVTVFISGPAALSCPDGKRKENKSYLGIFLF